MTVSDRACALAFSVKHPRSSFVDSSVVLFACSPSGVSSFLCELAGPAPRLSQLSFASFDRVPVSLTVVEGLGVAVGDAAGKVSLLGSAGSAVNETSVGKGTVEALCLLSGERLVCSCDDSLVWGDGGTVAQLGWTAAALATVDTFSVCAVGRRMAIHDTRMHKTALLAPLPAAGVSVAVGEARHVLVGLTNGTALQIDLRRPSEAGALVSQHSSVGPVAVALGVTERYSAGRDGVVARDGVKIANAGGPVLSVASESRLHALAASTATGRIWLAAQK